MILKLQPYLTKTLGVFFGFSQLIFHASQRGAGLRQLHCQLNAFLLSLRQRTLWFPPFRHLHHLCFPIEGFWKEDMPSSICRSAGSWSKVNLSHRFRHNDPINTKLQASIEQLTFATAYNSREWTSTPPSIDSSLAFKSKARWRCFASSCLCLLTSSLAWRRAWHSRTSSSSSRAYHNVPKTI